MTDEAKPAQGDAPAPPAVRTDEGDRDATLGALRTQWGDQFDERLARGKGALSALDGGTQDGLSQTRFRDGASILNDVDVLTWLTDPARRPDEIKALKPGLVEHQVEARIAQLEPATKYWRDDALERELAQLYRIRQTFGTRR